MNLYNSNIGITATTIVKSSQGICWGIAILTSGSTNGGLYDAAAVSGTTVLGQQVIPIPSGVTGFVANFPHIGWPCEIGITVVPGTGMTLGVAFQ